MLWFIDRHALIFMLSAFISIPSNSSSHAFSFHLYSFQPSIHAFMLSCSCFRIHALVSIPLSFPTHHFPIPSHRFQVLYGVGAFPIPAMEHIARKHLQSCPYQLMSLGKPQFPHRCQKDGLSNAFSNSNSWFSLSVLDRR
jgi:hypothetical protein